MARRETQKALISKRIEETRDTVTLRLEPINRFEWEPGQFIMVQQIIDGKSVRRAYSVSSSPTRKDYLEITIRRTEDPTMSKFLTDIQEGHYLNVRGPYGGFIWTEEKSEKAFFIGAGSGITPFRAFLQYKKDKNLSNHVKLLYTCAYGDNVIYKDELDRLTSKLENCDYELSLTREPEDSYHSIRKGRIDMEYLKQEIKGFEEAIFYMCGTPGFVGNIMLQLSQLGIPSDRLKREQW